MPAQHDDFPRPFDPPDDDLRPAELPPVDWLGVLVVGLFGAAFGAAAVLIVWWLL